MITEKEHVCQQTLQRQETKCDEERSRKDFKIFRLYNRHTKHVITKGIPVIIGTKRTFSKPSRKHLSNRRGKHESASILFSDLQGA
jgi:hypothetical protein